MQPGIRRACATFRRCAVAESREQPRWPAPMIVKVQIPIVTSEPKPMVLVYNEDRSVQDMFPYTAQLRRTLRGKLKSFWYAHLIPNREPRGTFTVSLDAPAPRQEW